MENVKVVPGMIVSLYDNWRPRDHKERDGKPMSHFYLVINTNNDNDELGYVQCMGITSMKNKDVKNEIPIIIDDTVTYVIPYNIHSFPRDEVRINNVKGTLVSNDIMSTGEFIKFLADIYHCFTTYSIVSINKEYKNHVLNRIREYQTEFRTIYHDKRDYRDTIKFIGDTRNVVEDTSDVEISTDYDWEFTRDTIQQWESYPYHYSAWTDDQLIKTLIRINQTSDMVIMNMSNKYDTTKKIDTCKKNIIKTLKSRTNPKMEYVINGSEYYFEFPSCAILQKRDNRFIPARDTSIDVQTLKFQLQQSMTM